MPFEILISLIRAGMNVGGAINQALEQMIRDEDISLPDIEMIGPTEWDRMIILFQEELSEHVHPPSPLAQYWDLNAGPLRRGGRPRRDAKSEEALMAAAREYWKEQKSGSSLSYQMTHDASQGENLLKQWNEQDAPPTPFTRVALSLAKVGLQYAQTNPSLFNIGDMGEKMVATIANQITALLPDVDDPEQWEAKDQNRYFFAERTLSLLLQAGLKTVNANPEFVANEKTLQILVKNTTAPLVELFDSNPGEALSFFRLQETLLGPVAKAAFSTLASNQQGFLGDQFESTEAIGAITAAVFDVVQKEDLDDLVTDGTIQKIASATMDLAVRHSGIFVADGEITLGEHSQKLISNVAGAINKAIIGEEIPLSKGLITAIGISTLETFSEEGIGLFQPDALWENVIGTSLTQLIEGLSEGMREEETFDFERLFSSEQAINLVRIILREAAKTPGMLTDSEESEVKTIFSSLATAIASDKKRLLSPDHWHQVASVMIKEASLNPGSLFTLEKEKQLGTLLIQSILSAASEGFNDNNLRNGTLSFGQVLVDAIEVSFRAAVGNVEGARQAIGLIADVGQTVNSLGVLVQGLNQFAADKANRVGSREWIWLYRSLIVDVIDQGQAFQINSELLKTLLVEET